MISGKHFGYDTDTESLNTKLQGEYKFYYNTPGSGQKKGFHVLVYYKEGTYVPAMKGFMNRLRKNYFTGGFAKSAVFCVMVLAYFWLTSLCRNYVPQSPVTSTTTTAPGTKIAGKPAATTTTGLVSAVCEHKSAVFFAMALAFVVVFTVGNVMKQIAGMRQRRQMSNRAAAQKKKH